MLCRTCGDLYYAYARLENKDKKIDREETLRKMKVLLFYDNGLVGLRDMLSNAARPRGENTT